MREENRKPNDEGPSHTEQAGHRQLEDERDAVIAADDTGMVANEAEIVAVETHEGEAE